MQSTADDARPDESDQLDDFEEPEVDPAEQLDDAPGTDQEPEGGEADETEAPGDGEPAPSVARTERRPGRREREQARFRELAEKTERLERELAQVRSQPQRPQVDPAEQARRDQSEREQVAVLPFDQQLSYWRDKDRREVQQTLATLQVQMADSSDLTSWNARCAADPVRQRMSAQVEQVLRDERNAGRNFPREVIYYALYGQEVDRQRGKQGNSQREAARRRVRAQTTQPGGSRSDVQRQRAPADDSYEAAYARVFKSGNPLW